MANFVYLIAALWIGHALCDFPLQGDFLAKGKDPIYGIREVPWWWCMGAHCAIQAGLVWVITGVPLLALLEFAAHWAIDYSKCRGWLGIGSDSQRAFTIDQLLHLGCKVVWAVVFYCTAWGA